MKTKSLAFRQIEWWIVTLVFLIIILSNILSTGNSGNRSFDTHLLGYFSRIFIPLILFLVFYLLHMVLIPNYLKTKNKVKFILFCLLLAITSYTIVTLFAFGANITNSPFTLFYLKTMAIYLGYLVWVIFLQQLLSPPRMKDYQTYNAVRLGSIFFF